MAPLPAPSTPASRPLYPRFRTLYPRFRTLYPRAPAPPVHPLFKQYKIQRCLYAIGLNTLYIVNLNKLAHKDKYGTKDKILLELRPEVKVIVILKTVCGTLQPQDVSTH